MICAGISPGFPVIDNPVPVELLDVKPAINAGLIEKFTGGIPSLFVRIAYSDWAE
jgi:hypothetical protein